MERARSRVADIARRHLHLKEALAFDGQIERAARRLQVSPAEIARRRHRPHTETGLEADRRFRRCGRRRAWHLGLVVHEIFELDTSLLEAGRVHVREVVRDVVDILLLSTHPAGGRVQRADHFVSSNGGPEGPHYFRPSSVIAPRSTSFISTLTARSSVSKFRVTSLNSATRSAIETFDCSSEPVTIVGFSTMAGVPGVEKRDPPSRNSLGLSPRSTIFNLPAMLPALRTVPSASTSTVPVSILIGPS